MPPLQTPNTEESATTKRLRFLERQEKRFTTSDTLALFAVVTLGLHIINLLGVILLYGAYSSLARKAPPTLVQLETGKTIAVAPLGSKERTPKVISQFVADIFTLMMNWSGTLPATTVEEAANPKPDPGIKIDNRNRLTTAAWQASFALSEDFRKEFLTKLAQITPSGVFNRSVQVTLVPLEIQPPTQIASGKWKVKMVANLMVMDKTSNLGDVIPFNKEIYVQAVEAPKAPTETLSELASKVYSVRQSGLEIYAIRDLNKENL